MLAHAQAELPNECCGLLAGKPGSDIYLIEARFPLVNQAASPWQYYAETKSLFHAHRNIRQMGLDVVAIYHSHPISDPLPSQTDRDRNYSPEVPNFIISLRKDEPVMRGWWLTGKDSQETEWEIVDPES